MWFKNTQIANQLVPQTGRNSAALTRQVFLPAADFKRRACVKAEYKAVLSSAVTEALYS